MGIITRILAVILFSASLAVPLYAAPYFVSPTGSDAAAGDSARPWLTLQHAADRVSADDTVTIRSGTYAGFRAKSGGTPGSPVVFRAEPGGSVLINRVGPDNRKGSIIEIEEYDWWVLERLEVTGAPEQAGIDIREAHHVTVRHCHCHHNEKWGIFTAFTEHFAAEYNECSHSNLEHGIYHSNSGDNARIRFNTCHHNRACGIQINADPSMGGDGISSGNVISHNILYENGEAGGAAINLASVRDSLVANNLMYDNHAGGIAAWDDGQGYEWGSKNNQYYHNTVHMPPDGRWALNLGNGSTGSRVFNNLLIHEGSWRGGLEIDDSSLPGLSSDYNVLGRISVDESPMSLSEWQTAYFHDVHSVDQTASQTFVNPGGNYHLKHDALAIDGGKTLPEVTTDLEGTPRPQGKASDVGAYEEAVNPRPDIKAGGADEKANIPRGEPAEITIRLDPGAMEGEDADWWILDYSPSGWRSFSIPGGWREGIHVFFQYELFGLPAAAAVPGRALEPGRHFFIFAVDTAMNGKPDLPLYYDFVEVEVSPAE